MIRADCGFLWIFGDQAQPPSWLLPVRYPKYCQSSEADTHIPNGVCSSVGAAKRECEQALPQRDVRWDIVTAAIAFALVAVPMPIFGSPSAPTAFDVAPARWCRRGRMLEARSRIGWVERGAKCRMGSTTERERSAALRATMLTRALHAKLC